MLEVHILTIFPDAFTSFLQTSLLGKAVQSGLCAVRTRNIRDFSTDKHHSVDDVPYGGGSGMVMKPEPLVAALEAVAKIAPGSWRVLLTPQGRPLDQPKVRELARRERLTLVCGRYEGVDERVRAHLDEEISLGDYVLSGGEVAAMVVLDAVVRLVPGVVGNAASIGEESFAGGVLEYPQYTRPPRFRDQPVPEILLSGDHGKIRAWRRREALRRTRERRPDLFSRLALDADDRRLLDEE
ncbi:MAG: tRNA (guanosine(37)-N1)-methyltransferase TrmD [Myxococcota bacterium]